jgi:hypothetical protein
MPRRSVFAPSSYHVDKASREFSLKHYKVLWEWVDWSFYPFSAFVEPMFLNPRRDVLSLDFNTLVRSDYPEYSAAHERVLFLLYNNPKPEIIHAVEILELSGVGTGELEIKDIAVDALGILEHFGGLKELRLLDIPHLADPSALGTTSWMFRKVVLRLVFCYAVLKVRGVRDRLPKIVVGGKEVVVEEDYEGCLNALGDGGVGVEDWSEVGFSGVGR